MESEVERKIMFRDKNGKFAKKRQLESQKKRLGNLKRRKIDVNSSEFLKLG